MPVPLPRSMSAASAHNHCQVVPLQGVAPLTPWLAPWMRETLAHPQLSRWVEQWGSPLNLHSLAPFAENVGSLQNVAADFGVPLLIQFARKANKCLSFVDESLRLGCGVDVASERELQQTLGAGLPGERIVCTAAIKERSLLNHCAQHGVTVVIDNADELQVAPSVSTPHSLRILLRVSGFQVAGRKLGSRFGIDFEEVVPFAAELLDPASTHLRLEGLHFHMDGYSADERIAAISQSLLLLDELRRRGFAANVLDIGGGFPVNYLESPDQWNTFWAEHTSALLGRRTSLTYRNHGLGLVAGGNKVFGRRNVYPFFQPCTAADWFARILAAPATSHLKGTLADELRQRNIQLRCEPGRALLAGCGMTIARVAHRKHTPNGDVLVGLAMNSSQCRTGSDDFMVDPLLITASNSEAQVTEGYLTGIYCTEAEVIPAGRLGCVPQHGRLLHALSRVPIAPVSTRCQSHC